MPSVSKISIVLFSVPGTCSGDWFSVQPIPLVSVTHSGLQGGEANVEQSSGVQMFKSMTLGRRLAAGFGVLLAMLLAVVFMAGWQMRSLAANNEAFADNIVPSLAQQHIISMSLANIRRFQLRHLLSDSEADMADFEANIEKERNALLAAIDVYEKSMLVDDVDRAHLVETRKDFAAYFDSWPKLRDLSRKTSTDPAALSEAKVLLAQELTRYNEVQKEIAA